MQQPAHDPFPKAGFGLLAVAVRRRLKQVVWGRLEPYNLTPQQFWLLLVLLEEGPMSLHPLSQRVWMDDPTASRIVKALVNRGFVQSCKDPGHGRRILISLAPEARPMVLELQALATELKEGLALGLSPEQRAGLRHGLLAVIANLDGMLACSGVGAAQAEGEAS